MKLIPPLVLFVAGLAGAAALADATDIDIRQLWIREGPPVASVLAAYVELENRGAVAVRLTGVASPTFERVEVHQTVIDGGVARMQGQTRLTIPAHAVVTMAPGGLHLMLMQPKKALRAGDEVLLRFTFEPGGERLVRGVVRHGPDHPARDGGRHHNHDNAGSRTHRAGPE